MTATAYALPDEPLRVIHADHAIVVVDKPAGLLERAGTRRTPGRLPDRARVQKAYPDALLVHRLDRDTSGIMALPRRGTPSATLARSSEGTQDEEDLSRTALGSSRAEGRPGRSAIDRRLAEPAAARDHVNGKPAQTDWKVLGHDEDGTTRVRLFR